jgi:hypothetical protein
MLLCGIISLKIQGRFVPYFHKRNTNLIRKPSSIFNASGETTKGGDQNATDC